LYVSLHRDYGCYRGMESIREYMAFINDNDQILSQS